MLILNCGGTFNKRYNSISGELEVPFDNHALELILAGVDEEYHIAGVVYKDSLKMDINDRKMIANIIMESSDSKFLIVHGTDTIDLTAEFLSEIFHDRKIVITAAMKPFEIDNVESSFNFGMAFGSLNTLDKNGVYICMNGYIRPWSELIKNKKLGKFELVR